jgi:hypothetical protein
MIGVDCDLTGTGGRVKEVPFLLLLSSSPFAVPYPLLWNPNDYVFLLRCR